MEIGEQYVWSIRYIRWNMWFNLGRTLILQLIRRMAIGEDGMGEGGRRIRDGIINYTCE